MVTLLGRRAHVSGVTEAERQPVLYPIHKSGYRAHGVLGDLMPYKEVPVTHSPGALPVRHIDVPGRA